MISSVIVAERYSLSAGLTARSRQGLPASIVVEKERKSDANRY